jgi:hypothetical protein
MPFNWGSALKSWGESIPTVGAAWDNREKVKRDQDAARRQAILDDLTAEKDRVTLGTLADEKRRQGEGQQELIRYFNNVSDYNTKKSSYDQNKIDEKTFQDQVDLSELVDRNNFQSEKERKPGFVGPPRPMMSAPEIQEPTKYMGEEPKKPDINKVLPYMNQPEVKGALDYINPHSAKNGGGLFAGWKKKNEERDAIISGVDPYNGGKLESEDDKNAAWDMWEKTWATSTNLGIAPKYIEGAAIKAKEVQLAQIPGKTVEAGATGRAGVIGKAEGETESNVGALPGFRPIPGVRITDESIGKVKGLSPDIESMKTMAGNLISKYNTMGMRFVGNEAADYMSQVRNLQLLAKSPSLYNLGVLTGPDLMLLEQAIPNPSSIKEGAKKQVLGDLSVKLKNFRDLLDMRGNQFYRINGFEREPPKQEGSNGASLLDEIRQRRAARGK